MTAHLLTSRSAVATVSLLTSAIALLASLVNLEISEVISSKDNALRTEPIGPVRRATAQRFFEKCIFNEAGVWEENCKKRRLEWRWKLHWYHAIVADLYIPRNRLCMAGVRYHSTRLLLPPFLRSLKFRVTRRPGFLGQCRPNQMSFGCSRSPQKFDSSDATHP